MGEPGLRMNPKVGPASRRPGLGASWLGRRSERNIWLSLNLRGLGGASVRASRVRRRLAGTLAPPTGSWLRVFAGLRLAIGGLPFGLGLAAFLCGCATAPPARLADLRPVLDAHPGQFGRVLAAPEKYRVQVLLSEVVTQASGRVGLKRFGYRVDAEYFYPASAIKLCAAVAALQILERLQAAHQSPDLLDAPLEIAPLFAGDPPQRDDPSHLGNGRITVGQELRKLALVSDNQAFNRLFDLVGHAQLNQAMHALGLNSVVINHRLSESRPIPNAQASAAVTLQPPNAQPIVVPARPSALGLTNRGPGLQVGTGYRRGETLVRAPMDFTRRNGISLVDLQDLLIHLVRPDVDLGTPELALAAPHRAWLLRAMTEYPRASTNPSYSAKDYPDEYGKFLLTGIRRVFPDTRPEERIQITGKIGRAYGFTIENACLYNPKNHRTVFVTAALYTNADGILNDDQYEYASVADPFLADLGEVVARRWLADPAR